MSNARWRKRGLGVLFVSLLVTTGWIVPGSTRAATCFPQELIDLVPELAGICLPDFSGLGGPTAPRPCANEIHGTSGNDVIQGTDGADCIFGHGGNDMIFAGSGFDDVFGGAGNDTIYGGAGDDYVEGDPCNTRPGDPTLARQCLVAGNDSIFGQSGDDGLYGAAGTDYVDGGPQSATAGDTTNGGTDGRLGDPQTSIDTCTRGESTSETDGAGHKVEECERII